MFSISKELWTYIWGCYIKHTCTCSGQYYGLYQLLMKVTTEWPAFFRLRHCQMLACLRRYVGLSVCTDAKHYMYNKSTVFQQHLHGVPLNLLIWRVSRSGVTPYLLLYLTAYMGESVLTQGHGLNNLENSAELWEKSYTFRESRLKEINGHELKKFWRLLHNVTSSSCSSFRLEND